MEDNVKDRMLGDNHGKRVTRKNLLTKHASIDLSQEICFVAETIFEQSYQ